MSRLLTFKCVNGRYLDTSGQKGSKAYTLNGIALFFGWLVLLKRPKQISLFLNLELNKPKCLCFFFPDCEDSFVYLLIFSHVLPFPSSKFSLTREEDTF